MDWRHRPRCDETPAWAALQQHFTQQFSGTAAFDLRQAFAQDADRAARFSFDAAEVHSDLSKNLIDDEVLDALVALADEVDLAGKRDAMYRGDRINVTENR